MTADVELLCICIYHGAVIEYSDFRVHLGPILSFLILILQLKPSINPFWVKGLVCIVASAFISDLETH